MSADDSPKRQSGILLRPHGGPLSSPTARKVKQQWCYLCGESHDWHPKGDSDVRR